MKRLMQFVLISMLLVPPLAFALNPSPQVMMKDGNVIYASAVSEAGKFIVKTPMVAHPDTAPVAKAIATAAIQHGRSLAIETFYWDKAMTRVTYSGMIDNATLLADLKAQGLHPREEDTKVAYVSFTVEAPTHEPK